MFYNLKKYLKFQLLKIRWRNQNFYNDTYPGCYFDIEKVEIGKKTYGQINAHVSGIDGEMLKIGSYCSIAPSVHFILAGEHRYSCISTFPFKQKILHSDIDTLTKGEIIVGDDVWIGENSTVLSGVKIGQGAVIAAGSVVTKDVPPYAIVGGVPAKTIRYRFPQEIINELMKVDYDQLTDEMIKEHIDDLYVDLKNKSQLEWLPKKLMSH